MPIAPRIIDDAGHLVVPAVRTRALRGSAMRCVGLGLRKGDRVALLIPDIREYLEADYGTMAAGLVRVPAGPAAHAARSSSLCCAMPARARLVTHASVRAKGRGI